MNELTKEQMRQFMRELEADLFVQTPEGPNEPDYLKAERKRTAQCFSAINALIESSGEKESGTDKIISDIHVCNIAHTPGEVNKEFQRRMKQMGPDGKLEKTQDCLHYGDSPAPFPAQTIKQNLTDGPSAEDELEEDDLIPLTPGELEALKNPAPPVERREGHCALKYDEATRTIKTFDPNPAPLPKEVEEAMGRMAGAIAGDYCYLKNAKYEKAQVEYDADRAALAVIKAALKPKVVTREWVEKFVTDNHLWGAGLRPLLKETIIAAFRERGIEVEP